VTTHEHVTGEPIVTEMSGADAGAAMRPSLSVPAVAEKPVLDVEGGPGRVSREVLRELWVFREVLWAFAVRQVKVKYKQAAIGVGWAIVQPVAAAALFALFLGRVANVGSEGVPYMLFALSGTVVWTYFSASASSASESLVADSALLRKVFFPREVLPLAAIVAGLVDFVPAFLTLVVASLLYGLLPTISWLALPLVIAVPILAAVAFGLGLSGLNVYYRDVRYVLPFVLQLGLFASPVVYSVDGIPASWRPVYEVLNPLAAAIDGMRRIVVHGHWPDFGITFAALGWCMLLLVGGYMLFKRLERGFTDRI
jgi:homopolymeric O-antigen transport system permease protein